MKNKILGLLMLVLIGSLTMFSFAADLINVVVDNETMIFPDTEPFVDESGRTQVPVRFVSEALGATVAWDNDTRTVSVYKSGDTIQLTIDQKTMYINGEAKELDTQAIIKESRTFVPLRFVSEALGATVSWEGQTKTAYISTYTVKEDTKIVESIEPVKPVEISYETIYDNLEGVTNSIQIGSVTYYRSPTINELAKLSIEYDHSWEENNVVWGKLPWDLAGSYSEAIGLELANADDYIELYKHYPESSVRTELGWPSGFSYWTSSEDDRRIYDRYITFGLFDGGLRHGVNGDDYYFLSVRREE